MFSLANLHTFGFKTFCKDYITISSINELSEKIEGYKHQPWMIIGEGSNCIFTEDYQGAVIKIVLKGINLSKSDKYTEVTVEAGENWHNFVLWCLNNKYYGLENLALIPGTVGAAPIQNIGAYGREVSEFISFVECYDLKTKSVRRLNNNECAFSYRDSIFKNKLANKVIITRVAFQFPTEWQPIASYGELKSLEYPTATDILDSVIKIRREKLPDPDLVGNAGSFFKNPIIPSHHHQILLKSYPSLPSFKVNEKEIKVPAAWLIDQCGFKGQSRGGIQCHPRQALVLTNISNGTGKQLLDFAREIKEAVYKRFRVLLENEVRLIGSHGPIQL